MTHPPPQSQLLPPKTLIHRRPRTIGQPVLPKLAPSPNGVVASPTKYFREHGVIINEAHMGFSFSQIGESVTYWINSLPESSHPLLDIGAGHGFQTVKALQAGRDVIAIDAQQSHLDALLMRWKKSCSSQSADSAPVGRIISTICARLPHDNLFDDGFQAAGILISEVMHFFEKGQPVHLMRNAARWLQPGGRLVVTCCSPVALPRMRENGLYLPDGRTEEEAWHLLDNATDEEIVVAAPTLLINKNDSALSSLVGKYLYTFSTQEMAAMARLAGLKVVDVRYVTPKKYPIRFSDEDEVCMLVAEKV